MSFLRMSLEDIGIGLYWGGKDLQLRKTRTHNRNIVYLQNNRILYILCSWYILSLYISFSFPFPSSSATFIHLKDWFLCSVECGLVPRVVMILYFTASVNKVDHFYTRNLVCISCKSCKSAYWKYWHLYSLQLCFISSSFTWLPLSAAKITSLMIMII